MDEFDPEPSIQNQRVVLSVQVGSRIVRPHGGWSRHVTWTSTQLHAIKTYIGLETHT